MGVRRTGIVLVLVAVIGLLLSFAAKAEEPADEVLIGRPVVLDVGEGVQCRVPGIAAPVPLPVGKMVPTVLWARLDDRLRVIEAENARMRAEKAETERQFGERLAQAIVGGVVVGVLAGAAGAWIATRPP